VLRLVLTTCTRRGFSVNELSIDQRTEPHDPETVSLWLTVYGAGSITELTAALSETHGVLAMVGQDATAAVP
jgi:putative Mg2+ transporter-C (MgtC) family protein